MPYATGATGASGISFPPRHVSRKLQVADGLMKLLDLPPELFDEVVAHYVASESVARAWKMRFTCRTFRAAITGAIYATRPIQAILQREDSNNPLPLQNLKAVYLKYPLKSLHDAQPYLLHYFREMRIRLGNGYRKPGPPTTAAGLRSQVSALLCEAMWINCTDTWQFMVTQDAGNDLDENLDELNDTHTKVDRIISMFKLCRRVRTSSLCHP
ncbi:hypothetical protein CC86DRAFT_407841 [Ophiobolus disseminans]|uniref:F-box domain-containing protein n=1 Tax=Ophiobolus disseminans TaxID=1469910 RepID=A0A6A6ZUD5_9PLEO|nr:hypothetical protein CC86DRAFT_407841 [Ophiobolus disseminans]